jgi:hypothetical protein
METLSGVRISNSRLWEAGRQTRRVFGWKELLEMWDRLSIPSSYIKTVLTNLNAAADVYSDHILTIDDFLTYLNGEEEGLQWLLYECVALRWICSDIPMHYIRELAHALPDVHRPFCRFPSSPSTTVYKFLKLHLSREEFDSLGMCPVHPGFNPEPLRNAPPLPDEEEDEDEEEESNYEGDEDTIYESEDDPMTPPARYSTPSSPPRLLRKTKSPHLDVYFVWPESDNKKDDHIRITEQDSTFTLRYDSKEEKFVTVTRNLAKEDILQYFTCILNSASLDKDPFERIQLTTPSMPSTYFNAKMGPRTRKTFYDSLEFALNHWPSYA